MAPESALALVSFDEVPAGDGWLGPRERRAIDRRMAQRRRESWRAGRWAARCALAKLRAVDVAGVEVLAAADGAPEVWSAEGRLPLNVSISHRGRIAVAIASGPGVEPGCDLELVEPRAAGFAADWFTTAERAAVDAAPPAERDLLVTLIWSAKESVLKVLRKGLRLDTRQVAVSVVGDRFRATAEGAHFMGWWKRDGPLVLTAAVKEEGR